MCQGITTDEATLARAWQTQGLILYALGDLDRALAAYEQALALLPEGTQKATVFRRRGLALLGRGELLVAAEAFGQAIALNLSYAMAYRNRGQVHLVQGDADAAIVDFDQALALEPEWGMPTAAGAWRSWR